MTIYDVTFAERLDVGVVPLGTSCCEVESIAHLWAGNAQRGENRPIPGEPGVDERESVIDQTRKLVAGWLYGFVDWEGTPPAVSVRATLQANVKHLVDNVEKPIGATKTATLWLPDGTSRSKPVQVKDLVLTGFGPEAVRFVLDLNFTKGIFEL